MGRVGVPHELNQSPTTQAKGESGEIKAGENGLFLLAMEILFFLERRKNKTNKKNKQNYCFKVRCVRVSVDIGKFLSFSDVTHLCVHIF